MSYKGKKTKFVRFSAQFVIELLNSYLLIELSLNLDKINSLNSIIKFGGEEEEDRLQPTID